MVIDDERIAFLKQETLKRRPVLGTDRMNIIHAFLKEQQETCAIKRRAQMFARLCEEMPLCIEEKEIIVGALGKHINTAQLYAPDSSIKWLEHELDTLHERSQDPFWVSQDDKKIIREHLTYWNGVCVSDHIEEQLSKEDHRYLDAGVFFIQKDMGYGHCLADYEYILCHGFCGALKRAEEKMEQAHECDKHVFYESVCIVIKGAIRYMQRYGIYARNLARQEEDTSRKEELYQLSDVCFKLVSGKAETFYEALQCVWFIQLMIHLESDGTGVSFGRLDQYLYPYYQNSLRQGETKQTMQKLMDLFWIKCNHLLKARNAKAASLWSGYIMNQNITISGVLQDGSDAANEVSVMCLKSQKTLTMKEPQFSMRIHEKTSDKLLEKALDCIQRGGGKPQFVSDKTICAALAKAQVEMDALWDYAIIGCIEPSLRGGYNRCKSGHINIMKVLELTLYDGYDPQLGRQIGKHTGVFEDMNDFSMFYQAFECQLDHMLSVLCHVHRDVTHKVLQSELPHPFLSALTRGCMEKGKDLTDMGARWNWTSFSVTGIANLIDSMYILEQEVFETRHIHIQELADALRHDYVGYERLRQYIMNVPRYGNHEEHVDAMARRVSTTLYEHVKKYRGYGNTPVCIGYVTVTKSVSMGRCIGATPDGRRAFTPLADGISPVHGMDRKGPLAVLFSTQALRLCNAQEGAILNQKFLPSILSSEKGRKEFMCMIRLYLTAMNGMHIQYNMVSHETLLKAQQHPENYRDLLVRVSGYSAYFVELSREVQQDVIERTQFM